MTPADQLLNLVAHFFGVVLIIAFIAFIMWPRDRDK